MTDKEKIALLEQLNGKYIDWMQTYRRTFQVNDGVGLPSGITPSEAKQVLTRRVLSDKPITIVKYSLTH